MKSIGTTLAIRIAVVFIVVMTAFGVYQIEQQQNRYTRFLMEKEDNTLKPLSLILGNLLFDVNREQIENVVRSYLNAPDILAIKVLEDKTIANYLGKHPETREIIDLAQTTAPPPQYANAVTQTTPLVYGKHELGSLEVVFSRQFVTEEAQKTIVNISGSLLLILVIETLIVLTLARKNISRPLLNLAQAAGQIAEGDIDIHLARARSRNELGTLTTAFEKMIGYIQTIADVAANISTGDLSQNPSPRSEKDVLGHAFQRMSAYLNNMATAAAAIAAGDLQHDIQPTGAKDLLGLAFQSMKSLRQTVSQVMNEAQLLRNASASLTKISTQMATNAEEASRQVQAVSSNSQQINQNVNGISTATEELAASIREILQNVTKVRNIVSSAVNAAQDASTTMSTLETHSQEIGEIIKVITTITQQTNLLALNATIEAARAGETGRGFAVVASEVKELARETAASAEDVTHRIETIQASTSEAVSAIAKISEITTQVYAISTAITSAVEEQAATANEISRNIFDAAHGSDEINQSIDEVAVVVEDSSKQAVSVQSAAEELTGLANELQQIVGRFKI